MSRLTARTENGNAYLVNVKPDEQEVDSPHKNTLQCILDCFERLAAYEDTGLEPEEVAELAQAKADGRCVVLPCKVGTEIWMLPNYDAYWNPIEKTVITGVTEFLYNDGTISTQLTTSLCLCVLWERDFGKTVFLTRAEAEDALQKEAQHE